MCGRFTLAARDYFTRAEMLGIVPDPNQAQAYQPRYNIAPTDATWVVLEDAGEKRLERFQWGLIPPWSKDGKPFINARIETSLEKPTFRTSLRKSRCLVPADGFYEWAKVGKEKRPHWFHLEEKQVFTFAGIFTDPHPKFSPERPTFSLLTTAAEGVVKSVHDRMPVILTKADANAWLNPKLTDADLRDMCKEAQVRVPALSSRKVGTRVNSPRSDDSTLIEPIA